MMGLPLSFAEPLLLLGLVALPALWWLLRVMPPRPRGGGGGGGRRARARGGGARARPRPHIYRATRPRPRRPCSSQAMN
ncbi:BatA domain-containing protein [Rhodopseudomonas sp. BAL398]|uniref:BatA domain-containing protein n=1 Tax=Rhodopseudomonas sp. BAL398 TaxID=3034676 RepID=UPI0023E1F1A6|nr:BatA domain-containing protein [Rhodopseudomonas sp. BAL398]MDF3811756.1 hypothetical protein [Rhodopseudomonas sp. BAL398]